MRVRVAIAVLIAGVTGQSAWALPKSCAGMKLSRYIAEREADGNLGVRERAVDGSMSPDELRCLADQGHRRAMFELGRRYEEGEGVSVDLSKAEQFYQKAATDIPENRTIYMPPVTLGGSGRLLVLRNANASSGLDESKRRLIDIRGKHQ